MRPDAPPLTRAATRLLSLRTLGQWVQRSAYVLLLLAAGGLLVIGRLEQSRIEAVRGALADRLLPLFQIAREPFALVQRAVAEVGTWVDLRQENQRLLEENKRLRGWQAEALRHEAENADLRRLVRMVGGQTPAFVSARVIGDAGAPFVRTFLLQAGGGNGVQKGQAVLADGGLIGRIFEHGERTSRVLLVTDLNSRIPVVLEKQRYRAILAGDNSDQPRLDHLPAGAGVAVGDRVVTSGHGGVIPAGLPVGSVSHVSDQAVRVQTFADLDRVDVATVIRFEPLIGLPLAVPGSDSRR